MAAAWQASGTLLGALTTADVTPVWPAHAAGDIGICITANRVTTNTCATPSGWTLLHGPIDTTGWRTYVFWIRATSSAMTNPLCDWTATSADKYAQIHTVRGAITTGSPFAASVLSADLTDPLVFTGVTSTAANQRIIVVCIASDNLSTTVSTTGTDPANYALNNYQDITTGADAEGHFASALRTSAGATGNVTCDFDAAMPSGAALVAAMLDPAAVDHPLAFDFPLGLTIDTALQPTEHPVAFDFPLGFTVDTALQPTEHPLAFDLPLGLAIDTNLGRETFIAFAESLAFAIDTAMTRETFAAFDFPIDFTIDTNLETVIEWFISFDTDLGLTTEVGMTRETFVSLAEAIDLQISTNVERETFVSFSEAVDLVISTQMTKETFAAFDLALALDSFINLNIEGENVPVVAGGTVQQQPLRIRRPAEQREEEEVLAFLLTGV